MTMLLSPYHRVHQKLYCRQGTALYFLRAVEVASPYNTAIGFGAKLRDDEGIVPYNVDISPNQPFSNCFCDCILR